MWTLKKFWSRGFLDEPQEHVASWSSTPTSLVHTFAAPSSWPLSPWCFLFSFSSSSSVPSVDPFHSQHLQGFHKQTSNTHTQMHGHGLQFVSPMFTYGEWYELPIPRQHYSVCQLLEWWMIQSEIQSAASIVPRGARFTMSIHPISLDNSQGNSKSWRTGHGWGLELPEPQSQLCSHWLCAPGGTLALLALFDASQTRMLGAVWLSQWLGDSVFGGQDATCSKIHLDHRPWTDGPEMSMASLLQNVGRVPLSFFLNPKLCD